MPVPTVKESSLALTIKIGRSSRQEYLRRQQELDGLEGISEDVHTAYCALSLTLTPPELKPIIRSRQDSLLDILRGAKINGYDPGTAPFSPDANLQINPNEIYRVDGAKIVGARFFVTHDILPSTGVGVEEEVARRYNRVAVMLHDANIRTSRMQPNRFIHLQYDDFHIQATQLREVFKFLQEFEPGMGFENNEPVLVGLNLRTQRWCNLERTVYETFPKLKYQYTSENSTISLQVRNPGIFKELQN